MNDWKKGRRTWWNGRILCSDLELGEKSGMLSRRSPSHSSLLAYCLQQLVHLVVLISWLRSNMGWHLFSEEKLSDPKECQTKRTELGFSFHLWDDFMLVVFFWASPTLECGWRCFYSKHVMYSAKWLGETRFFSLTMRPIIQTHKHIIRMTQNTVAYVR